MNLLMVLIAEHQHASRIVAPFPLVYVVDLDAAPQPTARHLALAAIPPPNPLTNPIRNRPGHASRLSLAQVEHLGVAAPPLDLCRSNLDRPGRGFLGSDPALGTHGVDDSVRSVPRNAQPFVWVGSVPVTPVSAASRLDRLRFHSLAADLDDCFCQAEGPSRSSHTLDRGLEHSEPLVVEAQQDLMLPLPPSRLSL